MNFTGTSQIPNNAFDNCASLKGLMIPSNVSYFGTYSFRGVTHISMTVLRATPPTASAAGSLPDSVEAIYVPAESVTAYKQANHWSWSQYASKIMAIPG